MNEWERRLEEQLKENKLQRREIDILRKEIERLQDTKYLRLNRLVQEAESKRARQFNILLQLAYDYHSFLDLFEDEETKGRSEHIGNILTRIEGYYGLTTSTKTETQSPRSEAERPESILPGDDYSHLGTG